MARIPKQAKEEGGYVRNAIAKNSADKRQLKAVFSFAKK
jgi:hypothetical protein